MLYAESISRSASRRRAPHAPIVAANMTQTHQIGKFELRKVLGKGASRTVYLALDTFSGGDVAL